MPLPSFPPFTFRHFRGESDYPLLAELIQAADRADGVDVALTLAEVTNHYATLVNCNPAHDTLLAEVEGQLVGYAETEWRIELDGTYVYRLRGQVHPDWRRRGLGRGLLNWQEAHLQAMAQTHPTEAPKHFQIFTADSRLGKVALITQAGYAPARYFYDMVRPNFEDIPDSPLPPGLEVRPALPEHYRLIWDGMGEAFKEHWGEAEESEADFHRWLGGREFAPDIWKVAWDLETNQVAGAVLGFIDPAYNAEFKVQRGWTENIAVRRPWRKRGLASALIVENLRELQRRGMTEAALGVDAENATGALQLYERLGFRVVKRTTVFRKPLS